MPGNVKECFALRRGRFSRYTGFIDVMKSHHAITFSERAVTIDRAFFVV